MAKKRPKQATLDALFSKLVRELADYRCEVCGRSYRHEPGGLHCSHHLSRSHGATVAPFAGAWIETYYRYPRLPISSDTFTTAPRGKWITR